MNVNELVEKLFIFVCYTVSTSNLIALKVMRHHNRYASHNRLESFSVSAEPLGAKSFENNEVHQMEAT